MLLSSLYNIFQESFHKIFFSTVNSCQILYFRYNSDIVNGKRVQLSTSNKWDIPQGSLQCPTLFLIYINYLPDVANITPKFPAGDTKLYSVVDCISGKESKSIQIDINNLVEWSDKWLLTFD